MEPKYLHEFNMKKYFHDASGNYHGTELDEKENCAAKDFQLLLGKCQRKIKDSRRHNTSVPKNNSN
ncbi:CLUMA_CG014820, isoform A [Clunio marinus]|uniref:CLUMA_CG014820, isoform A n=1 Tax=Clunio marinus TaxID=568069 RepID=A0A1J1ISN7_9DIPT|nr:CLUMA_CG014820, isoform A [Clunio marinus]